MNRLLKTIYRQNENRPPVWMMRQAGRYHSHYQALRKQHSFIDLCKNPELACETAMGPMREFNFDAAILFSDLLFPLEVLGTGLAYEPGPKLDWYLKDSDSISRLRKGKADLRGAEFASELSYQAEAIKLIKKSLPAEKGLLGFVGGPLTLFCYAVEGSHKGDLAPSKAAMGDGRYDAFLDHMIGLLAENMVLQAKAGADTVAVLDTCAGEFSPSVYREKVIPALHAVLKLFKEKCPETPIVYYSKKTGPDHWQHLESLPIHALGVDWNHPIKDVLSQWGEKYAIQGNVDPHWLHLESSVLEKRLREVFESVQGLPSRFLKGWICGLGHGILPKTPEENVHLFLKLQKEYFNENEGNLG